MDGSIYLPERWIQAELFFCLLQGGARSRHRLLQVVRVELDADETHPQRGACNRRTAQSQEWIGGEANPLGARAMYLGGTIYRIHGTNAPHTIGTHVSSGCLRLTNEDVTDLYSRVNVGTKVIVLPMDRRADNLSGKRG